VSTISSTITHGITIGTSGYASPLTITAAGQVSGTAAITAPGVATVVNAGTLAGSDVFGGSGVSLASGGYVTNQSGGVISGYDGIRGKSGGVTVINAGTIAGSASFYKAAAGILLNASGSITNQSSGTISGSYGILAAGADTVVNAGAITANAYGGIVLLGGFATNLAGGTITGYWGVVNARAAAAVVNDGVITGTGGSQYQGAGVLLEVAGSVTNQSGGSISGNVGVLAENAGTLVNAGTIEGAQAAVQLTAGFTNRLVVDPGAVFIGVVTGGNAIGSTVVSTLELASGASAGTLAGFGTQFTDFADVTIDAGADWTFSDTVSGFATLSNAGTLGTGITLGAGGTLINQSGGTIAGRYAIDALTSPITVTNAGVIAGSSSGSSAGIVLGAGGAVTNQSGGTIGGAYGVVADQASTLVNAGTMAGSQAAVQMADGYTNFLVVDPGAVFSGRVEGGNTVGSTIISTLELASGGSAGTLAGLGTQFVDFASVIVDAGADWVLSGSNTVAAGVGLAVDGDLSVAGSLVNAGTIGGTAAYAVTLGAGATLLNQAGAGIAAMGGIASGLGTATVVNAGSIGSGNTGSGTGIYLQGGGSVTNQSGGTISGGSDAVKLGAGTANRLVIDPGAVFVGTVDGGNTIGSTVISTLELASAASAGTLTGLGTQFVDFADVTIDAGASWTLSGTVSGIGTLTNAGTMGSGVTLGVAASITNQSGGTITGQDAIDALTNPVTVANAGILAGSSTASNAGIALQAGGLISNQSSGTISGRYGVYAKTDSATVTNAGYIIGLSLNGDGIRLRAGGTVTNQSGGTISAAPTPPGSMTLSSSRGIFVQGGGYIANQSGGLITGGAAGIVTGGAGSLTVNNAGVIVGYFGSRYHGIALVDAGIEISATASVTNQSSATISGYAGIYARFVPATVVNAGVIAGCYVGIRLNNGGYAANQASGTITGYSGVYAGRGATMVNAGIINGTGTSHYGAGVELFSGGTFTNQAGGTIGGYRGVYALGGAATLVNAGTIAGSHAAVYLRAGYANRLVVDPGAVFSGTVDGGNTIGATAVSTLELAPGNSGSGASAGTLTGLGTQFIDFANVTIDSGATWTLAGDNTVAAGVCVTNAGSLLVDGTLVIAGTISGATYAAQVVTGEAGLVAIDPGAVFSGKVSGGNTIGSSITSTLELASGASAGTLTGLGSQFVDFARVTIDAGAYWTLGGTVSGFATLTNAGTLGSGLAVDASAAVANLAGGTITGKYALADRTNPLTVTNAGYIAGPASGSGFGIDLWAGGSVTNLSGGTISGDNGVRVVNPDSTIYLWIGVNFQAGGYVTNQSGGSITGYEAIRDFRDPLTVINAGSIAGYFGVFGEGFGGLAAGVYLQRSGGSITNQSGGTITGYNGVQAYSATTVVNAGGITAAYAGLGLRGGGYAANQAGGTIAGSTGVYAGNAVTLVNDGVITGSGTGQYSAGIEIVRGGSITNQSGGTIAGAHYAVHMASGYANRLVIDPGAVFSGTVNGGNTIGSTYVSTLELASAAGTGTLTGLGTQFVNFGSIAIDQGADWFVEASTLGLGGTITGFASGDTIEVDGITVTGSSYADGVLTLDEASGSVNLNLPGDFTTNEFVVTNMAGGAEVTALCFCANTLIATPSGARPVQDLVAGDRVVTLGGAVRPITWVGIGSVLATRGRRSAATPVIVRKGALADNVPFQDLRVTKGHSFLLDGVLIPVEFLVNHRSILWDDRAQEVTLYHIELATHDVLVANGAPAESYRDDGNRWLFRNSNTGWDQPAKPPCAPVLTGGPIVDAAWRRLLDRAGGAVREPLTEQTDLHLLVDGARVDAIQRAGGVFVFHLSDRPAAVRIVSRSVVPQELGLARDPRRLGVALRQVVVRQGTRFRVVAARDDRLADGFHEYEPDHDLVWTDGDAGLPDALLAWLSGRGEVVLTIASTTRYIDEGVRHVAA
jgi:hypothetical protein